MATRELKFLLSAALLISSAGSLAAESRAQSIARQLNQQGYSEITVSRTWLGRMRIEAQKGEVEREIIVNRRTGEILRDYTHTDRSDQTLPRAQRDSSTDARRGNIGTEAGQDRRGAQRSGTHDDDMYEDTDFTADAIGGDDGAYDGLFSGDDPDYDSGGSHRETDNAFGGDFGDVDNDDWDGGHAESWDGGHDGGDHGDYGGGHDGGHDGGQGDDATGGWDN